MMLPDQRGIASVFADLITRGAGKRDSRELTLALDNLGLDRDESVGSMHIRFVAATLARHLPAALDIYADILLRPHLPKEEMDPVKALALQDLQSLEDEPRQKMLIELRQPALPAAARTGSPWHCGYHREADRQDGQAALSASVPAAGHDPLRCRQHRMGTTPPPGRGSSSVAGKAAMEPVLQIGTQPDKQAHIAKDTMQTQIGIAYPTAPIGHADYYAAVGAVNVLSGGMSARLFTEVREKRGLCYAVWASYSTFKDRASVLCYAGTTNERARKLSMSHSAN